MYHLHLPQTLEPVHDGRDLEGGGGPAEVCVGENALGSGARGRCRAMPRRPVRAKSNAAPANTPHPPTWNPFRCSARPTRQRDVFESSTTSAVPCGAGRFRLGFGLGGEHAMDCSARGWQGWVAGG